MSFRLLQLLGLLGATAALAFAVPAAAQWREPLPPDVREALDRAKLQARTIPEQADALARMAWPAGGAADPRIATAARRELVDFGKHSIRALRDALRRVDAIYTADVTAVLIESRYEKGGPMPSDYLPALEEALWFGSVEARRMAMKEFARRPAYPLAVLSTIDAIFDHPELTLTGLRSLGAMRDSRARFFLSEVLAEGNDAERRVAARSLGQLGRTAVDTLRGQARSADPSIRQAAIAGLLPVSEVDDLSLLLEYYGLHGDDDPELREQVLARAQLLEEQFEALHQEPPAEADAADDR